MLSVGCTTTWPHFHISPAKDLFSEGLLVYVGGQLTSRLCCAVSDGQGPAQNPQSRCSLPVLSCAVVGEATPGHPRSRDSRALDMTCPSPCRAAALPVHQKQGKLAHAVIQHSLLDVWLEQWPVWRVCGRPPASPLFVWLYLGALASVCFYLFTGQRQREIQERAGGRERDGEASPCRREPGA